MVSGAFGDQLMVLVNVHKPLQTCLWSHFLEKEEKELHHSIQCLEYKTRSLIQRALPACT